MVDPATTFETAMEYFAHLNYSFSIHVTRNDKQFVTVLHRFKGRLQCETGFPGTRMSLQLDTSTSHDAHVDVSLRGEVIMLQRVHLPTKLLLWTYFLEHYYGVATRNPSE